MLLWWCHLCYKCPVAVFLGFSKFAWISMNMHFFNADQPSLYFISYLLYRRELQGLQTKQECGHLVVKQKQWLIKHIPSGNPLKLLTLFLLHSWERQYYHDESWIISLNFPHSVQSLKINYQFLILSISENLHKLYESATQILFFFLVFFRGLFLWNTLRKLLCLSWWYGFFP